MSSEVIQNCPKISIKDYDIKKRLGKGAFNEAFEAIEKKTGKKVVIKISSSGFNDEKSKIYFTREVNTSHIDIPGIVKTLGYRFPLSPEEVENTNEEYANSFISVSEFMENGILLDINKKYLESNGKLNPTIRSKIIFGIAATMKKLHKMNIIHRDIKLSNIFLDDKLEPHIGDFGYARFINNNIDLEMMVGTPICMAPEIFMDDYDSPAYGFPVDVYSYAILLYQLFTNELKFEDNVPVRSPQNYMMKISRGLRLKRPQNIPDHYWDLIQRCWKQNPSERLTFDEITEILKDDKFALNEFGMKTDLDLLHQYQNYIDDDN